MSSVAVVGPNACTGEAARFMLLTKLDALLVVAPDGRLVGILTDADFLRQIVRDSPGRCGADGEPEPEVPRQLSPEVGALDDEAARRGDLL